MCSGEGISVHIRNKCYATGLLTKYRFKKYIGVAICVAGLVVVVFSDVHSNNRSGVCSRFMEFLAI
ncbi:hypothetical protein CsSME_00020073 [Camellia sinensis var. sinensis]